MVQFRTLVAGAAALMLVACQSREAAAPAPKAETKPMIAPILDTPDAVDIHSFAKPLEARVTHVALDLAVDFAAKSVAGTATLDVEAKPGVGEIVLDDKGLQIATITSSYPNSAMLHL